ncbi:glutaredoxin family protein [Candidatus Micrarchaeota archaeon]|nr:glutaredoxin family protein [Candidatus Micrarchaeota archaeon]
MVIVYSTTHCPWCVKLKDFLKQNNIQFEERNANENHDYAAELQQKSGGLAVPVTDVNGKIIVGFNVPKLKEALKIN